MPTWIFSMAAIIIRIQQTAESDVSDVEKNEMQDTEASPAVRRGGSVLATLGPADRAALLTLP